MSEPAAVEIVRVYQASCATLFRAWTRPETLRRWLAPGNTIVVSAEADPRTGGRFRIEFEDGDGVRHVFAGRYLDVSPNRRLVMTWTYDGPARLLCGEESQLTVTFDPAGADATELRLTHARIGSAEAADAYARDWPTCLDKLRGALQ